MLRQTVRVNTFETNSSSTHSCVICTEDEYTKWKNNEYFVDYHGNFYSKEDLVKNYNEDKLTDENGQIHMQLDVIDEDDFLDWCYDNEYFTFDSWSHDYEWDENSRLIDGKKIITRCYYGYDG